MSICSTPEDIAAGFVEGTTEFDWAELPSGLQASMVDSARMFLMWSNPPTVTITERSERAVAE